MIVVSTVEFLLPGMAQELEKSYDPNLHEKEIYKLWEESGYFNPDNLPDAEGKKSYTIIMPPPNATGILHAGHALFLTIEDIFIRWRRMQGYRALWIPGTDHAAIATQARVEKDILKKEDKNRYDLGRDELLKRIDVFVAEHRAIMTGQMRAMGSSCDWSREAFTLDEKRNHAVNEAFKRLYDLGLIQRDFRIVNWDPKGQTTISDDEIVYKEQPANLYTFKYSKDFPISIATTRPETKVGDVAVAVHPDDVRYQKFVGKEYNLTFCGTPLHITVVADNSVEKDFGTGAVGVTPAHSMTDAEIAKRHNLKWSQVIDERARMTIEGPLHGKKITEARENVVAWLKTEGVLEKEETITHNIATAERTGGIIEPLPKLQWFIRVNQPFKIPHSAIAGIATNREVTLKQLMRHVVDSEQINIVPNRFKNNYFNWVDNLLDWCISRQIWYGHRIPVWYKGEKLYCNVNPPEDKGWERDPDTLDTWFSSGLWTFSTLGWPNKTKDLQTYHPTDVMETAYEILFFWVARMILMTTALVGEIPFKTVYLHGLVRDEKRQKLSKSKADSADPLDLIEKFGADALRFALVFNSAPGTDSILSEEKIKGMKHFGNKLWNIARFVLSNSANEIDIVIKPEGITDADKNIITSLNETILKTTKYLDTFQLHEAAQELYQFTWHTFADVYIEASKPQLQDETQKENTQKILLYCLSTILKLLHPFMPFITETLYQQLPLSQKEKTLMIEKWPL